MHHIYTRKRFFLCVAPAVLVFIAFLYGPIIYAFLLSLTKYNGLGSPVFTGLTNYARMFQDRYFWISIKNTLLITATVILLSMPISFGLALFMEKAARRYSVYKVIIFAPYVIPMIVTALLWLFILDPKIGMVNNFLSLIGLDGLRQQWIGGRYLTPYSCGVIATWSTMGYNMAIWTMGMKSLPNEVLEASRLDGTTRGQQIVYIILPMLKETGKSILILTATGALKTFESVYELTGGGPNHMSETIVSYMYTTTFSSRVFGYGMAISAFEFLVAAVFTVIVLVLTRRRIDE